MKRIALIFATFFFVYIRVGLAQPHATKEEISPYSKTAFEEGRICFKEKNTDEAIAFFTSAIDSSNQFIEAFNYRGIAHCEAGHFYDAIDDFNAAIAAQPKYAIAYNNRGYVLLLIGGLEKAAVSDFTKAIDLSPSFAKAYYNRGIGLELLHQDHAACNDWTKASELQLAVPEDFFKTCKD